MKAMMWIIVGIVVVIALMILSTVLSQTDLLQIRVDQGIGSSTKLEQAY